MNINELARHLTTVLVLASANYFNIHSSFDFSLFPFHFLSSLFMNSMLVV